MQFLFALIILAISSTEVDEMGTQTEPPLSADAAWLIARERIVARIDSMLTDSTNRATVEAMAFHLRQSDFRDRFSMPIFRPRSDVDYAIRLIEPDPSVEYFISTPDLPPLAAIPSPSLPAK